MRRQTVDRRSWFGALLRGALALLLGGGTVWLARRNGAWLCGERGSGCAACDQRRGCEVAVLDASPRPPAAVQAPRGAEEVRR